jgi:flagellar hook-length control protein FliK
MPAVNPLLAIVAPASLPAKASRPGYALQDLMSARTPENTGVRTSDSEPDTDRDAAAKPFARELEKGLEQQSEQRESRRFAREEATRHADADRKEDAAARADGGKALPADGRDLPAQAAQDEHRIALETLAESVADEATPYGVASGAQTSPTPLTPPESAVLTPVLPGPLADAAAPADAVPLPLNTPAPATAVEIPAPLAAADGQVQPEPQPASPQSPASTLGAPTDLATSAGPLAAAADADAPQAVLPPAAQNSIVSGQDAAAVSAQAVPVLDASVPDIAASAAVPEPSSQQGAERSSNPFAGAPGTTDADAMALASQQAATAQETAARQAQSSADALAQAQGSEPSSLLDVQPGQGDLAERVRAWRGLSAVDGMALPSLTMRGEASSTSLFSQSSGQLQQFADSLRMAVNQADAPSLLPATERSVSTSTSAPATAPGALSSAAAAAPADAGGAWRADNLQMPALNGVARPAAGTLQFLQTMQPSNFGAPLGETFGQNAWAESVTQRVALMTGLKLSSARIELDPPELGAMTVKVSVSGDQASVSFVSPHAHVRDALEQNFPRLQEMLGQQGLQLADAQVSDQSAEQRQSGESASGSRSSAAGNGDERGESVSVQNVNVATSLIDYYA